MESFSQRCGSEQVSVGRFTYYHMPTAAAVAGRFVSMLKLCNKRRVKGECCGGVSITYFLNVRTERDTETQVMQWYYVDMYRKVQLMGELLLLV